METSRLPNMPVEHPTPDKPSTLPHPLHLLPFQPAILHCVKHIHPTDEPIVGTETSAAKFITYQMAQAGAVPHRTSEPI